MSEQEIATSPRPEEESTAAQPKTQSESQQDPVEEHTKSTESPGTTFSIWPPSQRTRDAVVKRLIETLANPSVLSKRYGTVPREEAEDAARLIEEAAYSYAESGAKDEDDGIEILQIYSKEISKRTLEAVKARASSGSTAENGASQAANSPVASTIANEEILSANES